MSAAIRSGGRFADQLIAAIVVWRFEPGWHRLLPPVRRQRKLVTVTTSATDARSPRQLVLHRRQPLIDAADALFRRHLWPSGDDRPIVWTGSALGELRRRLFKDDVRRAHQHQFAVRIENINDMFDGSFELGFVAASLEMSLLKVIKR